jgi:3-oxoacyl-[acyl-carrier protein] reductase
MADISSKILNDWYGLSGKTVLIWGCAGQIGGAISKCFAQLGASVIGTNINQEGLDEVAEALSGLPGRFIGGRVCDITSTSQLKDAVDTFAGILKGKPVDITVIVAGGTVRGVSPKEKFEDFDDTIFEKTVRLNYTAPVSAIRQSIRLMDGAEHPTIGAICSMSYTGHLSRVFGYRGSKVALEDTLSFLTQELMKKGKNWTVLGWRPGFVLAEQNAAVLDEVRKKAILDHMPRGEWQTAEDVARAIVTTCTPAFRPCHGAIIDIGAGFGHAGLGMAAL